MSSPANPPASPPAPPAAAPNAPTAAAPRPTIAELFIAFAAISLSGFGGVLAWARRIMVGALYAHYGDLPVLRRMLTGIAAAAAGLMIATVAKMARPLFKRPLRNRAVVASLIAVATFTAIGILHWPLPLALLVIVPVSIGAAFLNAGVRP